MPAKIDIATALREGTTRLASSSSARLDAELLLAHAMACNRTALRTHPERLLIETQRQTYLGLIERRAAGEPVAHLVGEREFWSLPLRVTPDTLIPRPETELVVEQALARLADVAGPRIADLGTGTGAIALALASELPAARVVATDASTAALAVARDNATRLRSTNIEFRAGDWCAALDDELFDLIASNPPYVRADDPHLQSGDVRFEPLTALAAAADGLRDLRSIVACAFPHLRPGGWLLLEHGYDQGNEVMDLMRGRGYTEVIDMPDLAGVPRLAIGRRPL